MPRIREIKQYRIDLTADEMLLLRRKLLIAYRNDDEESVESAALYAAFGVPKTASGHRDEEEPEEGDGEEDLESVETLPEKALRVSGRARTNRQGQRKSVMTGE